MKQNLAKRITLVSRPEGKPNLSNFKTEEFEIPDIKEGELLLQVNYLSLDPYMRGRMSDAKSYAPPAKIGEAMPGGTIATVRASKNKSFVEGDVVLSYSGWTTHAVSGGEGLRKLDPAAVPVTTALGVLGMPGFTAYSGLMLIGKPKPAETVVVAAASGPVGSLVGQLARRAGARAIGIAGGPDKCAFVKNELGFDAVVDHKSKSFAEDLKAAVPKGIDVYFENVGGPVLKAVLPLLNTYSRIPLCGLVSHYNGKTEGEESLAVAMAVFLRSSVTVRGFINSEFEKDHFATFLQAVAPDVISGKIKHREDIVRGLDNAPAAFIGMLEGKNFGKLIVEL